MASQDDPPPDDDTVYHYTGGRELPWDVRRTVVRVIVDSNVTKIDENVFSQCTNLKSIQLPDGLKEIGVQAFQNCESLSSIDLPNGLETIGKRAFDGCLLLPSIHIPHGVKSIGSGAFMNCKSLFYVQLPNGLEYVASGTFQNCTLLKSINIPNSVKKIGEAAFYGCTALSSIELPNGLKRIHDGAFNNCKSLLALQLPNGLEEIGKYVFDNCELLSSQVTDQIKALDLPPPSGSYRYMGGPVPLEIYENVVHLTVDPSVTTIVDKAFYECNKLQSVHLSDGVEVIGMQAFSLCESLSSVRFPNGLKVIGERAFRYCERLSAVHIANGLERIGEGSFHQCRALTSVHLPNGVTEIENKTFMSCYSLVSVRLPDTLKVIHDKAFFICTSLTSIYLPDGLEVIGEKAFNSCSHLSIVAIPSETIVEESAFWHCDTLEIKTNDPVFVDHLQTRFKNRPLHYACYRANKKDIKDSLTDVVAASEIDEYGCTPLHILASNPNATESMIQIVLEQNPDAIRSKVVASGMSPLHLASINCGNHVTDFLPHLTKCKTLGEGKFGCSVVDKNSKTPTVLSILHNAKEKVQQHLFKCQPCDKSQFDKETHKDQVEKLEEWYVNYILSLKEDHKFTVDEQHGWVQFANDVVDPNIIDAICKFIGDSSKCQQSLVQELAYASDDENRRAMDVAVQDIKSAFVKRLFFLGRYDLKTGPPIHKSDTCIVAEAFDLKGDEYYKKIFEKHSNGEKTLGKLDFRELLINHNISQGINVELFERTVATYGRNEEITCDQFVNFCKDKVNQGKYRKVAIKFMKVEEQFKREIDFREKYKELVKKQAVVEITEDYSVAKDINFQSAMETLEIDGLGESLANYKYAIVMPCADRNLDTISRSEKPSMIKIRCDAHQIACKLNILHENGIIHGDLKMSNIVRMGENLVLIDLDASATKNSQDPSSHVGKKFSSGILPPEMIFHLENEEQYNKFKEYFNHYDKKDLIWKKIAPKDSQQHFYYVVKTFEAETAEIKDVTGKIHTIDKIKVGLPYESVKASEAVDLWSFGTILYSLCARRSLFDVNVDDDLTDGDAMEKLYNWSDEVKNEVVNRNIKDNHANTLLKRILSKEPSARGTMGELLTDPFFEGLSIEGLSEKLDKIESKMDSGFDRVIHATYEANEVTHPTTFVVLKEKLPNEAKPEEQNVFDERLDQVCSWVNELAEIGDSIAEKEPQKFVDMAKEKFEDIVQDSNKSMYFYLVDDLTCKPMKARGYPIEITSPSDFVPKVLPYIQYGMKFMSLYNGTAGMLQLFGVPVPKVPDGLQSNLKDSVKILQQQSSVAEWQVVQKKVDENDGDSQCLRGALLRELGDFLKKHDEKGGYAGLRRIYDKETGEALWTAVADSDVEKYLNERRSRLRTAQEHRSEMNKMDKIKDNLKQKIESTTKEMDTIKNRLKDEVIEKQKLKEEIDKLKEEIKESKGRKPCGLFRC